MIRNVSIDDVCDESNRDEKEYTGIASEGHAEETTLKAEGALIVVGGGSGGINRNTGHTKGMRGGRRGGQFGN